MSESILKALMQLFAIIAASKEGDQTATHTIVEGFLNHELRHDLVGGYMKSYMSIYEQLRTRTSGGKRMKVLSSSSTKVLVICDAINKELVQRQKVFLLVRMLEFVRIGSTDADNTEQLNFVQSIARAFNVSEDEFNGVRDFVLFSSLMQIPESDRLLVVDSDYGFHSDTIKHIYSENLSGQIIFYKVASVNMYLFTFVNGQEVSMNGTMLNPDRVHVMSLGSSIRGPRFKRPIYYSDIVSAYNIDTTKGRIVFEVDKIEYKFPNGAYGLHSMSFMEKSGKLVGIMGSSGAGKTTLLNVLNGICEPSSGHVWINGIDIHHNNGELDGLIGYVSQDDLLIEELTVFQNLYYSAKQLYAASALPQSTETLEISRPLRNPQYAGGQPFEQAYFGRSAQEAQYRYGAYPRAFHPLLGRADVGIVVKGFRKHPRPLARTHQQGQTRVPCHPSAVERNIQDV